MESALSTRDLAKAFGRGTGFGIGLIFLTPIFALILGATVVVTLSWRRLHDWRASAQ